MRQTLPLSRFARRRPAPRLTTSMLLIGLGLVACLMVISYVPVLSLGLRDLVYGP